MAFVGCGSKRSKPRGDTIQLPQINPHKDPKFLQRVKDLGDQLLGVQFQGEARIIFVPLTFVQGIRFDDITEGAAKGLKASQNIFESFPFFYEVNRRISPPASRATPSTFRETFVLLAEEHPLKALDQYVFTFTASGRKDTAFVIGVSAEHIRPILSDPSFLDDLKLPHSPNQTLRPMILIKQSQPIPTTWRTP